MCVTIHSSIDPNGNICKNNTPKKFDLFFWGLVEIHPYTPTYKMTVDLEYSSRKIPLRYKPIEYIVPKTVMCVICCQNYDQNDRIVECSKCKQQLHSHCQFNWCYESILSESAVTCPFCRQEWKDNGKINYLRYV